MDALGRCRLTQCELERIGPRPRRHHQPLLSPRYPEEVNDWPLSRCSSSISPSPERSGEGDSFGGLSDECSIVSPERGDEEGLAARLWSFNSCVFFVQGKNGFSLHVFGDDFGLVDKKE